VSSAADPHVREVRIGQTGCGEHGPGFLAAKLATIGVIGTAGRIRADWPSDVVQLQGSVLEEYRHLTTIRPELDPRPAMYGAEIQAWVHALVEQRQPPITAGDGVRVLEIIDAVFESSETATPVTLS
jgi:predicted dehydrogenase